MQIAVSVFGILIMVGVAWLLTWYKEATARRTAKRAADQTTALAGGEE
jgi:hypothetical protein